MMFPRIRSRFDSLDQKHLSFEEFLGFDDLYVWSERGSGMIVGMQRSLPSKHNRGPVTAKVWLDRDTCPRYEVPDRANKLLHRGFGYIGVQMRVKFEITSAEWITEKRIGCVKTPCWEVKIESKRPTVTGV